MDIVYASRIPPRRPRTLRTWLLSPRNFGKTRFRRFATFDFLTPKIFFRKKKSEFVFGFSSLFSSDFGGSGEFWTSKSGSWRHFAADGRVLRPVRGLEAVAGSSDPRTAPRPRPSYARFSVFLEAWILSAWKLRRIADLCSLLHALRPEASADFSTFSQSFSMFSQGVRRFFEVFGPIRTC